MVVTLTTGAIFVMWLGEQITERGIGNGMSLLITFRSWNACGRRRALAAAVRPVRRRQRLRRRGVLAILVVVVAAVVAMTIAARRSRSRFPGR